LPNECVLINNLVKLLLINVFLAGRNIAGVTGGKPIAVKSQFILGVSAIYPLVAFYDIP
jgi:hypothetical protein